MTVMKTWPRCGKKKKMEKQNEVTLGKSQEDLKPERASGKNGQSLRHSSAFE